LRLAQPVKFVLVGAAGFAVNLAAFHLNKRWTFQLAR
jgi:putative flippase GtrA